eukprot:2278873-Rhodomonas_salina.1
MADSVPLSVSIEAQAYFWRIGMEPEPSVEISSCHRTLQSGGYPGTAPVSSVKRHFSENPILIPQIDEEPRSMAAPPGHGVAPPFV